MARYIALLRGINVGRAKRVPMADLRAAVDGLGASDVKTLLNSGNVVFTASRKPSASAIEAAVLERTGVSSTVTVLTGAELRRIVDECPLVDVATDPSRMMVAVTRRTKALDALRDREWAPEQLAIGSLAAYLWLPDGVKGGSLNDAVNHELGDAVTTRNWKTIEKILAAV